MENAFDINDEDFCSKLKAIRESVPPFLCV